MKENNIVKWTDLVLIEYRKFDEREALSDLIGTAKGMLRKVKEAIKNNMLYDHYQFLSNEQGFILTIEQLTNKVDWNGFEEALNSEPHIDTNLDDLETPDFEYVFNYDKYNEKEYYEGAYIQDYHPDYEEWYRLYVKS